MKRGAWKGLTVALVLLAWAGSGCRKANEQANQQAADSAARNLTLLPTTSSAQLNDVPAPGTTTPAAAPAPAPAPEPRTRAPRRPAPAPAPRAPAAPASYTAAAGTHVPLAVTDAISSRSAKAGQAFTATVRSDVVDAAGHVVIPQGSTVTGTIVEVKSGGTSNAGTLTLAINGVTVRGTSYPLEATIESAATIQQGRGVTGNEAVKVGAGAAAGAIAGRILGKNTRGTVIGAVVGAAAGAGVAAATRAVDIVLPAGGQVDIALTQPVTVPAH
jgi:hypothetical protein